MEEYVSEDQKNAILRRRKEMLEKMGVKNAGQTITESVVGAQNSNMAQKLAALKRGAARDEFSKYIQATGKNAPGQFQALPEPSKKSSPNSHKEEVKPEFKQELASFSTPQADSSELDALERMFSGGDTGPARMSPSGQLQSPADIRMDIDPNTGEMSGMKYMPTFNPQAALQNKRRAVQETQHTQEEFVPASQGFGGMNMQAIQIMMETIAKGIAEKTIRNVLNEYSEQQKSKVFFEYYNKEQGVIKTADGKLYKLTPVTIKKK